MELLIGGTWFGGVAGGALTVLGVLQAVSRRSVFPVARSRTRWSERQLTSIGLGWVLLGIFIAIWSLAGGLLLADHVIPPPWLGFAGGLVIVLGNAANLGVALLLGGERSRN